MEAGTEHESRLGAGRRVAQAAGVLGFLLALLLAFHAVSAFLVPKDGNAYSGRDYRALVGDSVDALFIGASSFWSGVSPMMVWAKTGVTSYVVGSSRMPSQVQLYLLKESLKTQQPKVVFLGVQFLVGGHDVGEEDLRVYQALTPRPLTKEKLDVARAVGREAKVPVDTGYLLAPLFAYHANWKDIQQTDFVWEEPGFTMGQRWPDCYVEDFSEGGAARAEQTRTGNAKADYAFNTTELKNY